MADERLKGGAKLTKAGDVNLTTEVGKGFKEILENMDINYRAQEKTAKTDELNWQRYGDQFVKEEVLSRKITREAEEAQASRQKEVDDADNQLQIDQLEGINNDIELEAYRNIQEDEERKKEEKRAQQVEKAQKKMAGESGLRGLIKVSKEGFKNMFTSQKDMGEHFDDLRGEFASDMDFLSSAMAPLTQLPGVNAAMKTIKFIFIALWKGLQWMWNRRKARDAKADAEKRSALLKGGKSEEEADAIMAEDKGGKHPFLIAMAKHLAKGIGIITAIITGMVLLVGNFFSVITAPFRTNGRIFKLFGSPKWVTKVGEAFSNIFGPKGKIVKMFTKITNLIPKSVLKLFGGGKGGVFGKITKFLGGLGKTLGKFFWPITVLMSAWEAIKGFIAGFKDTEGGIVEKMIGGIGGAIGSLVDFIIMWPLDLIKDLVAWVGEKMGFDTTAIKDFSFSDLWNDIWGSFTDGILRIVRFFKAIGFATAAAVSALWPGGEGPIEAFSRVYNETINAPAGLTSVSGGESVASSMAKANGASITEGNRNWEDESAEAEEERIKRGLSAADGGGNNIALDKSVTINKKGDAVFIEDTEPKDGFGSRLSGWYAYQ